MYCFFKAAIVCILWVKKVRFINDKCYIKDFWLINFNVPFWFILINLYKFLMQSIYLKVNTVGPQIAPIFVQKIFSCYLRLHFLRTPKTALFISNWSYWRQDFRNYWSIQKLWNIISKEIITKTKSVLDVKIADASDI